MIVIFKVVLKGIKVIKLIFMLNNKLKGVFVNNKFKVIEIFIKYVSIVWLRK